MFYYPRLPANKKFDLPYAWLANEVFGFFSDFLARPNDVVAMRPTTGKRVVFARESFQFKINFCVTDLNYFLDLFGLLENSDRQLRRQAVITIKICWKTILLTRQNKVQAKLVSIISKTNFIFINFFS